MHSSAPTRPPPIDTELERQQPAAPEASGPQHAQRSGFLSRQSLFANIKSDFSASLLEFLGTIVFLLLGLGGIQAATAEKLSSNNTSSPATQVMYISTSMGLSLLISAWLFFRVTGGLFNPNVSLALLIVGVIKPVRFVLYCIAQMLAAIIAAALVRGLTSADLSVNNTLAPGTSPAQGVFIECFTTTALVLSVLLLAAEKHQVTPFAPVGVGLTLFAGHLFAVYYTGAAMNTARAFGPAVVSGFPGVVGTNHWIYWLGPFLGSLLASAFYYALKYYHYETLTPGQATTNTEKSPDPVTFMSQTVKAAKVGLGYSDEEGQGRKSADGHTGPRRSGATGSADSDGAEGGRTTARKTQNSPREMELRDASSSSPSSRPMAVDETVGMSRKAGDSLV